jgi:hypothetical protein
MKELKFVMAVRKIFEVKLPNNTDYFVTIILSTFRETEDERSVATIFNQGTQAGSKKLFQNIYFLILIPVTPAYLAHLF